VFLFCQQETREGRQKNLPNKAYEPRKFIKILPPTPTQKKKKFNYKHFLLAVYFYFGLVLASLGS
jgi:hypothetical protein